MPPGFEWDALKAENNRRKHGVAFEEAATAFDDPTAIVRYDDEHSSVEDRLLVTGRSASGRHLTVSYTMRGEGMRIISARPANRRETRQYEERDET